MEFIKVISFSKFCGLKYERSKICRMYKTPFNLIVLSMPRKKLELKNCQKRKCVIIFSLDLEFEIRVGVES